MDKDREGLPYFVKSEEDISIKKKLLAPQDPRITVKRLRMEINVCVCACLIAMKFSWHR